MATAGSAGTGKTEEKQNEKENTLRSSRIHGNIGTVTAQKMIKEELEISPQINVINYITESFKKRFCILVY